MINLPALVDPVNDIAATSGCFVSQVPTPAPSPFTRLNTPFGKPASSIISASNIEDKGAISDGFNTTEHPAASAGATFNIT